MRGRDSDFGFWIEEWAVRGIPTVALGLRVQGAGDGPYCFPLCAIAGASPLWFQDEFSHHCAGLQEFVGPFGLGQREPIVNRRANPAP